MEFSEKFKVAIIFLGALIGIAGFLVAIYFILKKDLLNCMNNKKDDGVEQTDTDSELDETVKEEEQPENQQLSPNKEEVKSPRLHCVEEEEEDTVPEIVVTKTNFTPEKSKKTSIKSVFKKITKPIGKVRFGSVSSNSGSGVEQYPLVGSNDDGYGSLQPMQRSDSMESFLSGVSVVSENIEEFGEELSPGRLQTSLEYDKRNWTVNVGVKQAECLIFTGKQKIYWQVHITLLPFKKHRFKTKYKSTSTPIFNQTFDIDDVAEQALGQIAVRFRVYGRVGRTGKKKLAGETEVNLRRLIGNQGRLLEWNTLKRKKQKMSASNLV